MNKVLGQKELACGVSYKYMYNTMVLSVFIYRFFLLLNMMNVRKSDSHPRNSTSPRAVTI